MNRREQENFNYFKHILTKKNLSPLVQRVAQDLNTVLAGSELPLCELLSQKAVSEIASNSYERNIASHFSQIIGDTVRAALSDNDPDLLWPNNRPLEIKVTAGESWRGGKYSKRESCYLLIARDKVCHEKVFVALAHVPEEEWTKPKKNKAGEEKYYATTFGKKRLLEYVDAGKACVLVGDLHEVMRKDGTPYNKKRIKLQKT